MLTRLLLAAAAAATLAACGGSPQSAGSPSSARKALLDYAACMRKHGVPMKDPTFNAGGGGVTFSATGRVDAHTQRVAQQACGHYMQKVGANGKKPSAADQARFRQAALAQARCMRAHGITNFPDPKFGANGEASMQFNKDSGIDPHDPAFQRAQQACSKYMPGKQVIG
jgi:hypothetical protein